MSTRQFNAKEVISEVFIDEEIDTIPTRAEFDQLAIPGYPSMQVRRIFGSWDRAMKKILRWKERKEFAILAGPPTIDEGLADQNVAAGAELEYTFFDSTFTNLSGAPLVYTLTQNPEWVSLDNKTISGTAPAYEEETQEVVTVRATTIYGAFAEVSFTITVTVE